MSSFYYQRKIRRGAIGLLLCGSLALSLMGCSEASKENAIVFSDTDFTETSFTGVVDSIDGSTITLSITLMDGKAVDLSMMGMGGMDFQGGEAQDMPQMPDGNTMPEGDMQDFEPGGDVPEKPEGDGSGDFGQASPDSSQAPEDFQPGDMGDPGSADTSDAADDSGSFTLNTEDSSMQEGAGFDGGQMPEGDGQMPEGDGQMPEGDGQMPGGDMQGEMDPGMMGDMEMPETTTITATLTLEDDSILKDSQGEEASLSDIQEGTYLKVELGDDGAVESLTILDANQGQGQMQQPGGSGVESYDAATNYTSDTETTKETYASTGTDENAIHVYDGAVVTLNDPTITRTSSDSTGGDNSSFYGVGAALLVTDGTVTVNGGTIDTDAKGGAGIFAYDKGIAYVSDTAISTEQDTSGGIHVAGGGTLYAWNLTVDTQGGSSAAIRSDRGSGTMVVDGGTYTSNGTGSPAIYSTADITVNDAKLTASASEAICIEGLNTIRLFDCDLSGAMKDDSQNDCTWNVIVYQSMSGDSEQGNGTFSMTGGSLTAENGGMFYTTNTESTFYLSGVDITYASDSEFFLRCTGNNNQRGWGTAGSNGADCSFTADGQEMEGTVIYDSISTLEFYMNNGSKLTGSFMDDETYAQKTGEGYCNVYISSDSTWIVTGDSTIDTLSCSGTIQDAQGKSVTVKDTDGNVLVQGDSSYIITVKEYKTTADMSNATEKTSFSDYSVSKK